MMHEAKLHLFEAVGIEIEYMIVDKESLNVCPIADVLLRNEQDEPCGDVERGLIAWSNELSAHVIELKCNGPCDDITRLHDLFYLSVQEMNHILEPHHAMLLPTGMHPWMKPHENRLWPHEYNQVYQAFDRIFDCSGLGWCNVQSTHINLPFADDREFTRLHTAIRVLLPLLPALTASSPQWAEKKGPLDQRLRLYQNNAKKIPQVAGRVIPEPVRSIDEYHTLILHPLYQAIKPYDAECILQHEWLNARGAIARFERNAIEIRVLDTQERTQADLAMVALVVEVLKMLVFEALSTESSQLHVLQDELVQVYQKCVMHADAAVVNEREYLKVLGYPEDRTTARMLWRYLIEKIPETSPIFSGYYWPCLEKWLYQGSLATRMVKVAGARPASQKTLRALYRELAFCLNQEQSFLHADADTHRRAVPASTPRGDL